MTISFTKHELNYIYSVIANRKDSIAREVRRKIEKNILKGKHKNHYVTR